VVGCPEIPRLLLLFKLSPGGRLPLVRLQLYGVSPPLALTVALYWLPTLPFGTDVVVIVSEALMVMLRPASRFPSGAGIRHLAVKLDVPCALGYQKSGPCWR